MNRDDKNYAFEKWYQEYIKTHDVGNPAKYKEFARWAFWGGIEFAEKNEAEKAQKYGSVTV